MSWATNFAGGETMCVSMSNSFIECDVSSITIEDGFQGLALDTMQVVLYCVLDL